MIWFLIICTQVSTYGSDGSACLAAQRMPNKEACLQVRKSYLLSKQTTVAQCRGVKP